MEIASVALRLAIFVVSVSAAACPKSHETDGTKNVRTVARPIGRREAGVHDTRSSITLGGNTGKRQWGVLIVDAKERTFFRNKNADRIFVPASNMKLLTTALALRRWDPTIGGEQHWERKRAFLRKARSTAFIFVGRAMPTFQPKIPFDTKEDLTGHRESSH